ncbi:hypothetical protein B0T21DRAFT_378706 [Apiosordaria backusii]|uniref:Uncharacterized protein n=1 Tax=Apiosordaria backusii TaxID=314023 RepID=A0AA40DHE2_9PEZI|nr:hypothetical protein B0T21DRAFT_378706 [Apiosordaria backusii]
MPPTPSSTQPLEFEARSRPPSPRPASRSPSLSSPSSISSRPVSVHFMNAFGGPNDPISPLPSMPYAPGTGASTPTLSVTHPDGSTEPFPMMLPDPLHAQQQQSSSPLKRDIHMTAGAYDTVPQGTETVEENKAKSKMGRQRAMSVDSIMNTPGCCGLCERGTAKMIGGKITAWVMGTLIPVTFGVITRVLSRMFH